MIEAAGRQAVIQADRQAGRHLSRQRLCIEKMHNLTYVIEAVASTFMHPCRYYEYVVLCTSSKSNEKKVLFSPLIAYEKVPKMTGYKYTPCNRSFWESIR